ncbi:RNA polymerase sigma factor [Flexivirga oryzae]|uniref:DNA-directed RNA polymerase specialized sigma24 family protein n=1 Tax=Flexivirga oryzae TaxID=1794944 RepID=A0A839N3V8_9MICO|nr:sigma factor-like helix-turn-helix DNA-binding protein [Flexivirga oryzae]MBB2892440.1 DNA-directed RNA polymerase specialized sigma24 family protein [Flexivirga oryzae]
MGGSTGDESELGDFVAARTAELHRTAYLLTADQDRAERLVEVAVAQLARHRTDIGQAGAEARRCMARLAATATTPTPATRTAAPTDDADTAIADLSPRQRAVLLLRCLDGHDTRSTARELGLAPSKVTDAEQSASHTVGFEPHDDRLRAALTDFSERATWPDPDVTLSRAEHVQPPRRHSRKRYIAAAAVIALTAAAPIGSQIAHDRWLNTPAGINASHGTHLRPYIEGYKLVGAQRVPAGAKRELELPSGDVITVACDNFSPTKESDAPVVRTAKSTGAWPCFKQSARFYYFATTEGNATIKAPPQQGHSIIVGIYRPVPWADYPVAQDNFHVVRRATLDTNAKMNFTKPPVRRGKTLVMTGRNGVFTGTVKKPAAARGTTLFLSGLLLPTTTGQYKVEVDGQAVTDCSYTAQDSTWCRFYDRDIRPVPLSPIFGTDTFDSARPGPVKVRVVVRDALGPWKLQLRYDRYDPEN